MKSFPKFSVFLSSVWMMRRSEEQVSDVASPLLREVHLRQTKDGGRMNRYMRWVFIIAELEQRGAER